MLSTAQYRDLAAPLLRYFQIHPDHELSVMRPAQTLNALTARLLEELPAVFETVAPDIILAQGDTTTVSATALACFHADIRFGHVEAGLRTGVTIDPFPEEFNRVLAARVADVNFVPTPRARDNLLREGVDPARIRLTGNTGIDSLRWVVARDEPVALPIPANRRVLLVTLHRGRILACRWRGSSRLFARW